MPEVPLDAPAVGPATPPAPDVAAQADDAPTVEANLMTAARGGSVLFAGKLFTYLTRFGITIVLTRLLGNDQYGLYNLSLALPAFVASFAVLGLDSGIIRFASIYRSRGDDRRVLGVFQIGILLPLAVSLVLAAGLIVAAPLIATQVFHDPRLTDLTRIAALTIPLLTIVNQLDAALRGLTRIEWSVLATNFIMPILRVAFVIPFLIVGLTVGLAIFAYVFSIAAVVVLMVWSLNRYFRLRRRPRYGVREPGPLARFSLPVFLSNVIGSVGDNLQTFLLGALQNVATVGIFAVANQITLVGKMFHNAVTVASMPLIAEIHDRSDAKRLGAFFRTTTQWTTTFNLPFLLILLLFPHQLLSIFGKGFESGATALGILAWANLAVFATGPVGVIIDMTGNTWVKFANSILLVGLAIVLNLVLIPPYGLVGAAVADLAANVLINVVRLGEVWLLLGLHPYGRPFLKPILAAVVAAGAGVATGRLLPAQHGPILEAVLGSVALSVVYVAMIVALGISAEDRALLGRVRTALVSRGARASRRRARAERGREDAP